MYDKNDSAKRQMMIDKFFQNRINESLSLSFVNNWGTTHRVVMEPQTGTFKVAFDNAFAGKAALHVVPTQRLFYDGA